MPCHHVGVQASQKYPSRLHSAHQGNDRWSRLTNRNSSSLRLERSMLPSSSFKNKQLHLPSDRQKWGLKKLFYHQNCWMRLDTKPLYWMGMWGCSTASIRIKQNSRLKNKLHFCTLSHGLLLVTSNFSDNRKIQIENIFPHLLMRCFVSMALFVVSSFLVHKKILPNSEKLGRPLWGPSVGTVGAYDLGSNI